MPGQPQPYISPEDYLRAERFAPTKHEYLNGEVFAMAGASRNHNRIVFNLGGLLHAQLASSRCEGFVADMRVKVTATGLYTYPDVVVVCGEAQFEDAEMDTLLNPTVIFEVLSPSTEMYDRTQKFAHYRKLPSLQDYLLVAQDRCHVERYERQDDGRWLFSELDALEATVRLERIGCALPLAAVYAGVALSA